MRFEHSQTQRRAFNEQGDRIKAQEKGTHGAAKWHNGEISLDTKEDNKTARPDTE